MPEEQTILTPDDNQPTRKAKVIEPVAVSPEAQATVDQIREEAQKLISMGNSALTDIIRRVLRDSPIIGGGATGDVYYRNASGQTVNLPIGTAGQYLKVASSLPSWATLSSSGILFASGQVASSADVTINTNTATDITSATFTTPSDTPANSILVVSAHFAIDVTSANVASRIVGILNVDGSAVSGSPVCDGAGKLQTLTGVWRTTVGASKVVKLQSKGDSSVTYVVRNSTTNGGTTQFSYMIFSP